MIHLLRATACLSIGFALLVAASASRSSASPNTHPGRNGLIAFEANGRPDRSGIAVVRADGRGFRMLTRQAGDTAPAWSPGGRRLVFSRGGDLYAIGADGTGLRRLTRGRGSDADPTWSPDGRRIAFSRSGVLYVMNANGSSARRLATGHEPDSLEGVAWSPDGRTIAFGATYGGSGSIEFVDPTGGESWSPLEGDPDARNPDWSPDGRSLVFERPLGTVVAVWLSAADGRELRELLVEGEHPSFAPDGKRVVASADGRGLVIGDLAGRRRAVPGTSNARNPAWQPVVR